VGDVLIGYASDSIHANGWSLVRRVLKEHPGEVSDAEMLEWLKPTRLYHDVTKGLRDGGVKPKAMSHITGGGLPENLERLFRGMGADLEIPKWDLPGIEKLLAHVDAEDRFHTFNMGIGWVAIVSEADVPAALEAGPGGVVIGRMVPQEGVRVRVKGE
jgi:phosphoribosylformylglycinamidine cyclo-ligase